MDWPFGGLLPHHYGALYVDPPWSFMSWSPAGDGKNANQHYDCMSLADLRTLPVRELAAPDCALFMWVTDPMLPFGIDLMREWGFSYKTVAFYWMKTSKDGLRYPIGTGYWTRANPEPCLLGTIGKPKRLSRGVRKLIVSPRREHSRKPDEIRERIEKLVPGPYAELFARTAWPGWASWGNERERFTGERLAA